MTQPFPIISPDNATGYDAVATRDLCVSINGCDILRSVDVRFPRYQISTIVGPSGGGKSTLLRCINQIGQMTRGYNECGEISVLGHDVIQGFEGPEGLRLSVGMVFQSACVFPNSILQNVVFGLARQRKLSKAATYEAAEKALRSAALWEEVKDRLDAPATHLSLGQKQRLCIARVLAMEPQILLMDEPTASLDPISVRAIEDVLLRLKSDYTIILVTHDLAQMNRIADYVAYIDDGQLIAQGTLSDLRDLKDNEKVTRYFSDHIS